MIYVKNPYSQLPPHQPRIGQGWIDERTDQAYRFNGEFWEFLPQGTYDIKDLYFYY